MKTRLVFALHFHQPVGNFDSVFQEATRTCYLPVLEHFERHPTVKGAFHFSGCLLEWLENNDHAFVDRLISLVGKGQVEPMGGGFYEPILSIVPREDALEQISRLQDYWKQRTGVTPKGLWLAERVWEPSLTEILYDAGIQYTILDDQHLRFAGFLEDYFQGLYCTERVGKSVAFFPSDFTLRYLMPFRTIETVREHFLKIQKTDKEAVLTYGDDAEKFGVWPGTYQWVIREQWLEKFFQLLEDPQGPIQSITPSSYLAEKPISKKVYVPNASYAEMLEWALPPKSLKVYSQIRQCAVKNTNENAAKSFIRGSLWDMFLARYPESDHMHKHVLWTSQQTRGLNSFEARTYALRGECNCPYWHGLFGGLYLPHLRHGIYQNILAADAMLAEKQEKPVEVVVEDLDGDQEKEIVLRSKAIQSFFRPSDAGTFVELDFLPSRFNVCNGVSRWREAYHDGSDLTHSTSSSSGVVSPHEKSVGVDLKQVREIHFDDLPLRSAREFWTSIDLTPSQLSRFENMALAKGRMDFWQTLDQGWKGNHHVRHIGFEKTVEIPSPRNLSLKWKLDPLHQEGWFGTLFYFTLLTPNAPDRLALYQDQTGKTQKVSPGSPMKIFQGTQLSLEDHSFGFSLSLNAKQPGTLLSTPIHTLQRSEKGYEPMYQGTLFAWAWPLEKKASEYQIEILFTELSK